MTYGLTLVRLGAHGIFQSTFSGKKRHSILPVERGTVAAKSFGLECQQKII